jgi:hypothetical protein
MIPRIPSTYDVDNDMYVKEVASLYELLEDGLLHLESLFGENDGESCHTVG